MNRLINSFASISTLCIAPIIFGMNASAGTRDGGGGVGVQCVIGQTTTIQLLDLYEAQSRGWHLFNEPKDAPTAISLASDLMARHFWNIDSTPITQMATQMNNSIFEPIFTGQPWYNAQTQRMETVQYVDYLPLSLDIGSYQISENCRLVQIAYYDDKNTTLKIVKTIWDQLSLLNRVALETHELLYLFERRNGVEGQQLMTSQSSRELVGELYSSYEVAAKFPQSANWTCYDVNFGTDMSYFYISHQSDGTWGLYFSFLHGGGSAFQILSVIPGISIENLLDLNTPYSTSMTVPVNFIGDSFAPPISMSIVKTTSGYPTIQFFEDAIPMGSAKEFNCHQ